MIRSDIRTLLKKTIQKKLGDFSIPEFSLAAPENPEHGDYATNVALLLARTFKKNPMEIASALAEELRITNKELEKIEVAPPGFINFFVSDETIRGELKTILEKKERYGAGPHREEKIQVEFISANPTGPLTLANGRGGFLGDALANVLQSQGFEVEREYYVNDAGNQVRTLGLAVLAVLGAVPDSEEYYHGEHITEWAHAHRELAEREKESPESLGKYVANDFLNDFIKPVIEGKMRIRFDRWTSEEQDIRQAHLVDRVEQLFREKKLTYEAGGARWLRTTDFSDDKDRVLMTADNFPTYFLVDAGHYWETKERGFFQKVNILGADHHGYVSRIQAVAKIIGLESRIIVMQLVRLISGDVEVRMSKRKGTYVTMDELIDEVGVDAARFFFLERAPETHMDFDLDLAKKRSSQNPVYYVQYAHARMASILRKAKSEGDELSTNTYELLRENEELNLIKKLARFPEILEDTARDYQVHRLPRYALELARIFHNFYESHRVITDDSELTEARLALVSATKIVLKNTLGLMGIDAPEKM